MEDQQWGRSLRRKTRKKNEWHQEKYQKLTLHVYLLLKTFDSPFNGAFFSSSSSSS